MRSIEITTIELGGEKYELVLTHQALRRAEIELNRTRNIKPNGWLAIDGAIASAINSVASGQGFPHDLTEILLWAALATNTNGLTPETIGNMITDRKYVVGKIAEAIGKSYPTAAPEEGGDNRPLPSGPTSGPSEGST